MFDKQFSIADVMALRLKGELSSEAERLLQEWLLLDTENRTLFNELMDEETVREKMEVFDSSNSKVIWNKILIGLGKSSVDQPSLKKITLWTQIAASAAILFVIGFAILFYLNNTDKSQMQEITHVNDIVPGKQAATLTLANGKVIRLSAAMTGEIANETGISITKSSDGNLVYEIKGTSSKDNQINVLATAKGETYKVRLPDGSSVWLNAASSLTYSAALNVQAIRRVKLGGEAYFQIAKDKSRPFIVEAAGQEVEVLGTHFNISAYANEPSTKVTLLEGSIRLNKTTILKPNSQAVLTGTDIKVIPVDAEAFIDWQQGVFNFDSENLESIMRKVSRWYDVEVIYQTNIKNSKTFTGTISRSKNISEVLKTLHGLGGVNFEIEGRTIKIK